jgi:hypothetical protein
MLVESSFACPIPMEKHWPDYLPSQELALDESWLYKIVLSNGKTTLVADGVSRPLVVNMAGERDVHERNIHIGSVSMIDESVDSNGGGPSSSDSMNRVCGALFDR